MSSLTSSTTIITALAIPVQKNLSASDNRPLSTWISVSLYYSCKDILVILVWKCVSFQKGKITQMSPILFERK
uniref:Uncharacterized protein n=1 Tax=Nelumbo nucifera TaxID=4432 RepID=A0A822XW84_NELNU|nr:TPA_asm: hypothetical protein HUJ06_025725 [Nelumbo nucifera]